MLFDSGRAPGHDKRIEHRIGWTWSLRRAEREAEKADFCRLGLVGTEDVEKLMSQLSGKGGFNHVILPHKPEKKSPQLLASSSFLLPCQASSSPKLRFFATLASYTGVILANEKFGVFFTFNPLLHTREEARYCL